MGEATTIENRTPRAFHLPVYAAPETGRPLRAMLPGRKAGEAAPRLELPGWYLERLGAEESWRERLELEGGVLVIHGQTSAERRIARRAAEALERKAARVEPAPSAAPDVVVVRTPKRRAKRAETVET